MLVAKRRGLASSSVEVILKGCGVGGEGRLGVAAE